MTEPLKKIVFVAALVAAVIAGHLLPGLDATGLHMEIRNGLHIVAFALIAAVFFEVLPLQPVKAALTALLLVGVVGLLSEYAQTRVGKPLDFRDLARDVAGAALYLCARLLWHWANSTTGRAGILRFAARAASVVLGILIFVPLAFWLYGASQAASRHPTILNFDGPWDTHAYQPVASEVRISDFDDSNGVFDGLSAEVRLLHHDWSGIRIVPAVSDWSAYEYLTLRAAITGAYESQVIVTLNDGKHPNHSSEHRIGSQSIGPDSVIIRFPLRDASDRPGRPALDPSNILAVHIIGRTKSHNPHESGDTRLYVDEIRLE